MERRGSRAGEHPPAAGGATLAGGGKQTGEGLVAAWMMAGPCRRGQKARPEPPGEDVPADTASEQMRSSAGLFWTRHRFSGSRCWDVARSVGEIQQIWARTCVRLPCCHEDGAELDTPSSTNRDPKPRAPGVWESQGLSPPAHAAPEGLFEGTKRGRSCIWEGGKRRRQRLGLPGADTQHPHAQGLGCRGSTSAFGGMT